MYSGQRRTAVLPSGADNWPPAHRCMGFRSIPVHLGAGASSADEFDCYGSLDFKQPCPTVYRRSRTREATNACLFKPKQCNPLKKNIPAII